MVGCLPFKYTDRKVNAVRGIGMARNKLQYDDFRHHFRAPQTSFPSFDPTRARGCAVDCCVRIGQLMFVWMACDPMRRPIRVLGTAWVRTRTRSRSGRATRRRNKEEPYPIK